MRVVMALLLLAGVAAAETAEQQVRTRPNRDWKTINTDNFLVHYRDDEIRDRALEVGAWLEDAYLRFGEALGTKLRRPAHCFVYRSVNDFQATTIFDDGLPENVLGVTELFQDRIVVPCIGSDKLMQRVVQHEFMHQLMFNEYFPWKIPSFLFAKDPFIPEWFVEGLAEYQSRDLDTWDRMLMRDRALDDEIHHIYNLHGFTHLRPHEVREAYIEGNFILRHLESVYGEGSVRKLYQRYDGFPWPASARLKPITNKSYRDLDREFQDAMKQQAALEAVGTSDPDAYATPVTVNDSHYRRWNMSPRFSPDGSQIAYLSDRSGVWAVHVVNADGSSRRSPLLFQANNIIEEADPSISGLSWSPDGTRIAFIGERGQSKAVYTCGTGVVSILHKMGFKFEEMSSPAWSPDGKRIAFSALSAGRTDIWVGDVDEGTMRQLTKDPRHDDHPCWSPDGKTIVYASERKGQADLFAVDVATGESVALAETHASEVSPQFSPDGKYLAYASDEGGIWNVWVMELAGGRAQRITNVPCGAGSPSWGPGGQLAFAVYRHGEFHIWKMTLNLEDADWQPVPRGTPNLDYEGLFVKQVEGSSTEPLRNRWHFDFLLPLGYVNVALASTLTGDQTVAAQASLVATPNGARIDADLAYLNLMLPLNLFVDVFNRYRTFDERDVSRTEHQFGFFAGTLIPLDPYRRVTLGYTLYENRINFDDGVHEDKSPRNAALLVAFTHNNVRGRGINAFGGFRVDAGAQWFADGLGSVERRTNYFWNYRHFIEIWEDIVVTFGTTGHLSFGRDPDPTDAGDVVRGYRHGHYWGDKAAGGFIEVRFPIWRDIDFSIPGQLILLKDVRAYVFADAGFVTDDHPNRVLRSWNHPDWRHSVGAGIYAELYILELLPLPIGVQFAQPTDSRQPFNVTLTVAFTF